MFAGPADAAPKALVEELISDTCFAPTYLGPIRYARNLEVWEPVQLSIMLRWLRAACSTPPPPPVPRPRGALQKDDHPCTLACEEYFVPRLF